MVQSRVSWGSYLILVISISVILFILMILVKFKLTHVNHNMQSPATSKHSNLVTLQIM